MDELLVVQHGVLSRAQATEFIDPLTLRHWLGHVWRAPHPRVVVTHNGPLTPAQRDWAALLAAPDGSALWGGSAARWDGFRDRLADDQVHVVQPVGTRRLVMPGVTAHWSSRLGADDVHPTSEPRRTRIARSVIDLASSCRTDGRARTVVFIALQQRLATTEQLAACLDARGPCRHRAELAQTLGEAAGGIHSLPERDFSAIVRRWRLPEPSRQAVLRRPDGRYYLDALWLRYLLTAEVDGVQHRDADQWESDLGRTADVVAQGLRQIRFSSYAVRRRADLVGDRLSRALRSGGWDGVGRS